MNRVLVYWVIGCVIMGVAISARSARAPETTDYAFLVRVMYVTDLQVKPYDTRKRCEVTRAFTEKELPELPGYHKIVACMPINK